MLFSEWFGIARKPSDDWFDPHLSVDTPLFLDPFLLEHDAGSEWNGSHEELIAHFARCYELVATGGDANALSTRLARRLLTFPEPSEVCLGYTASGTQGSGTAGRYSRLVASGIAVAISAGLTSPEHIEEIGILNEGIGADRVSDATCNVLKARLILYTKKVAKRHKIPTEPGRVRNASCDLRRGRWVDETHELPGNPFSGEPILLVPRRLLRELPTLNAYDWFESSENADLRLSMNVGIGQRVPKSEIVHLARKHPDRLREWARAISEAGEYRAYDFENDPLGVVGWYPAAREYAAANPLQGGEVSAVGELKGFVAEVLGHYRRFIEDQGGWRLLWNKSKEKNEEAAQLVLLGLGQTYGRSRGVEIDREVQLGRGPVDFKISAGAKARLLVEVKKLHNGEFWGGLEAQLTSYLESDATRDGWLLAVRYRDEGVSKSRARELPGRVSNLNEQLGTRIDFSIVDARPKASASKLGRDRSTTPRRAGR